ncbi:EF-hand domain-containing family member B [Exaiptasia diaphana]|uniref:EF-hand domain-containing protein n=1 Tax=Exaiptasia diaphana TaxID=2652724 RepID=A0A913YRF8_EXADI|nr:EF-hand domain-containing family member B [Exaiptasia diaphana]XP_020910514.1 EF-hand domain-containing family member B [Exaiptasia diaphana]XP_028517739.1 EF-hand domain-containing family member B [Exaiptasia diaphana]XP_028517759.1 EF-hand domain-containing family member B [Exaiptasia diaphana]KXJ08719.1 EF-hand domain-containing family member B [Exaiptasia diaphana]KXJ08776.1 EF-hand domain-containing family member B [Exaiptasia diaphana]
MLSNKGKFIDRSKDISAAGKLFDQGKTARECLLTQEETQYSDKVKKFRATTQPHAGVERVFHGRADDPNIAKYISHGVSTKPSLWAGDLANPPKKSLFAQKMLEKKEGTYASSQKAPLGECHDQMPNLPSGAKLYEDCYGVKTIKDGTAGEMVNPAKTAEQVVKESLVGKDLYKFSHHDYDVGEGYDRKYDWNQVPKNSTFGIETPHNNDGIHVKKSLKWLHDIQQAKCTKIVSKRVDNFRERTQPQLGQCHDPIKDTLRVGPDHVFGVIVKPDEYGAGDLIHMRMPSEYLRGRERERGIVAAIRQHLKKANYHNFNDLKAAFEHYDKDNSGMISLDELAHVCIQFNLPVEQELLKSLLATCDADKDGQINYTEFANFLNWKDQMPSGKKSEDNATTEEKDKTELNQSLSQQIDKAVGGWKKSSSQIRATVGGIQTNNWRAYGVPTIRSDLAAPRIRRVGDRTNYGDESDAYGLINPSLYSNHGVYEKDFFQPRDRLEMRRIIDGIGVEMTPETFDEIWNIATTNSPQGLVSVESFRNVMDEASAPKVLQSQAV